MADPIDPSLTQIPGLSQYLAMKQYMINQAQQEQARGLQNEFIQKRQALGPNASPEQLTGLATQYASPQDLMHYGLQSQDKKATLAATIVHHNQLIDVARERNDVLRETNLSRVKDKEAQDIIMNGFRERDRALSEQKAKNDQILKELGLGIAQQRADTAQQAVEQKGSKLDEPLLNMLDKIDATKRMIQANPEAVGGRGMLGRGAEFVGSMMNPGQETPASNLQSQILDLQTTYRGLPGHAASRLKIDAANIDKLIKGLGTFTAPDQAIGSLDTLRETIAKQLERRSGATEVSTEPTIPSFPPAPADPAKRKANDTYLTPRGPLKWTGTGWVPK